MMNTILIDVSTDAFAYQTQRNSDTIYHLAMAAATLFVRFHQYVRCVPCIYACLL